MAFAPLDQSSIFGNAMAGQGDYRAEQQRAQLLSLQQDQLRMQQQAAQAEQQTKQAYQQAVENFIANPTAQAASELQARFPEYQKEFKAAWDTRDKAAQDSDLREMASVYGYLNAGATDKAKAALQRRIDADKAAGEDTAADEQMLALIDEDPARAKGAVAFSLAAITGDKFANTLEQTRQTNMKGQVVGRAIGHYDDQGNWVTDYRDPDPVQYRNLTVVGPDGEPVESIVALGGEGGDPSAGATRADRNNNPGNLRDSPFTRKLPGYKGADSGGFAIFDSPVSGSNAQAALLGSYMDRGYNTVSKIISRWAPPSDGNDTGGYVKMVASALGVKPGDTLNQSHIPALQQAIARVEGASSNPSNGPSNGVVAMGAPKATGRPMTAEEKQKWGLPAEVAYKMGPDGPVLIGGQDTRTNSGRPVPESTAKRVADAVDQRESLSRALRNFKSDFAGNTMTGGLENWAQGKFGVGTPGQREWWADFYRTDNQIRNDLFGSALTATEQAAYERTSINPSMSAATIRNNLKARADVVNKALARQQKFLKANNYNPEAVDALFASDALGDAAPVAVRTPAEAQKLAPGTLFTTPDGRTMRRK